MFFLSSYLTPTSYIDVLFTESLFSSQTLSDKAHKGLSLDIFLYLSTLDL